MNAKNIISIALRSDWEEIFDFLDRQGLAENAWLIWSVSDALQRDEVWEIVLTCSLRSPTTSSYGRRRHQIVGVAYMLNQRKVPVEDRAPGFDPGCDYDVRMDAENSSAVEAMIAAFPSDQLGRFSIFRPLIQAYFDTLPGVSRREDDLYFTVSPERFRPVSGEEVVELTAADADLFEGCERQPRWEDMGEEFREFGIVRDGRVATSTGVAPIAPAIAMKRRVIALSGLHTETPYRRLGLGKRLVSYVTELILRDGDMPLYWTEPDNVASQALAQGLGYWQIAQQMTYSWRKE